MNTSWLSQLRQELDQLQGSGAGGRVTKQDILEYVKSRKVSSADPAQSSISQVSPEGNSKKNETPFSAPAVSVSGQDEIIEMDRMRKLIADHMVMSKHFTVYRC